MTACCHHCRLRGKEAPAVAALQGEPLCPACFHPALRDLLEKIAALQREAAQAWVQYYSGPPPQHPEPADPRPAVPPHLQPYA